MAGTFADRSSIELLFVCAGRSVSEFLGSFWNFELARGLSALARRQG